MEVTKHNFKQLFNTITSHINSSTFISFDLEFTGLNIHSNLKNTSLDTMQHRYMKLRENVSAFWPLQIGICCFELQNHKAVAHPYSFYLFPLAIEGSRTYSIQPSSISFLAQHGFDFNKSFIDGITFMNSRDKEILKSLAPEVLVKPHDNKVTHEMRAFLEMVKDQLKSWDKQEPLRIPTEYIRKAVISYVIKEIESNYEMMCEIEYETRFCKAIIITPGKREMPMDETINFSDTIEAMRGKIIMGHNMLLDLMYLHEKFITPLPPRVEDFGAKILEYFPKVLDTKVPLQNSSVLKRFFDASPNQNLEECTQIIAANSSRFSDYPIELSYEFDAKHHDAAYDAFQTGSLYIRSAQLMRMNPLTAFSELDPYINRTAVAGRKVPYSLKPRLEVEKTEDIYVILLPKLIPPEVVKASLERQLGPIAIFKIFWTNEMLYCIPTSSRSRKNLQLISKIPVEDTNITITNYDKFIQGEKIQMDWFKLQAN